MSKVITPHFKKMIDCLIASGRFNSKSKVIRAGLRLLEESELRFKRDTRAELDRILDEDLADTRPPILAEQLHTRRTR